MTQGALGGGYKGANSGSNTGGYGGAGGTGNHKGGFLCSGTHDANFIAKTSFGNMGSHLMIVADTIKNFNIHAISTGG